MDNPQTTLHTFTHYLYRVKCLSSSHCDHGIKKIYFLFLCYLYFNQLFLTSTIIFKKIDVMSYIKIFK